MQQALIYITSIIVFILIIIFLIIVSTYAKKKSELLLKNELEKQRFEQAIAKAQIEVQEQILKNIGAELHDNLGQLLSIVNMQLNILEDRVSEDQLSQLQEANHLVERSIDEIRLISKTFNTEYLENKSLSEIIQIEIDRFNRLRFIQACLEVEGDEVAINAKDQIIIFRILQEFINNSLKHAAAKNLNVRLHFSPQKLRLKIQDNGKGFNPETVAKNAGLYNMESRAKLIAAGFKLTSQVNKGTQLTLTYNIT